MTVILGAVMYKLDETLTFCFVLAPSASPIAQSAYDIVVEAPDGTRTYVDNDLDTYVAPTATVQGSATYDHTVNMEGRWRVVLTTGVEGAYTELSDITIFVISPITFTASTTINRRLTTNLGT
jgi:hypothetical protein